MWTRAHEAVKVFMPAGALMGFQAGASGHPAGERRGTGDPPTGQMHTCASTCRNWSRLWDISWPLSGMEVLTFAKELIITAFVVSPGCRQCARQCAWCVCLCVVRCIAFHCAALRCVVLVVL